MARRFQNETGVNLDLRTEYEDAVKKMVLMVGEHGLMAVPDEVRNGRWLERVPVEYQELAKRCVLLQGVGASALDEYDDEELLLGATVPDSDEGWTVFTELVNLHDRYKLVESMLKAAEEIATCDVQREEMAVENVIQVVSERSNAFHKTEHVEFPRDLSQCKTENLSRGTAFDSGTVFDTWMNLAPEELGLLVSAPSVGKSSSLVDIGCGYIQNVDEEGVVIWFSEEMSKKAVMAKCAARLTGEQIFDLKALEESWPWKPSLVIESHTMGTSTVDFLKSRVMKLAGGRRVIAIMVDYLGVMNSTYRERYDKLADIVIGLKGKLAKQFSCPVWSAVQPQRNPSKDNRTPISGQVQDVELPVLDMPDISECWAIPQVADYIISLNQTVGEANMSTPRVRLFKAKARWPSVDAPGVPLLMANFLYDVCQVI